MLLAFRILILFATTTASALAAAPQPMIQNIRFGVVREVSAGIFEFVQETKQIPYRLKATGFRFGIAFENPKRELIEWYEVVHFPVEPVNSSGNFERARSRTMKTTPRKSSQPTVIEDFWFDEGDPFGPHRMELIVNGVVRYAADFVVEKAGVPAQACPRKVKNLWRDNDRPELWREELYTYNDHDGSVSLLVVAGTGYGVGMPASRAFEIEDYANKDHAGANADLYNWASCIVSERSKAGTQERNTSDIEAGKARTAALQQANRDATIREQELRTRVQGGGNDSSTLGRRNANAATETSSNPRQPALPSTAGQMHSGSALNIGGATSNSPSPSEVCKCGSDYLSCITRNARQGGGSVTTSQIGSEMRIGVRDNTGAALGAYSWDSRTGKCEGVNR